MFKKNKIKTGLLLSLFFFLAACQTSIAQTPIKNIWKTALYITSVYHNGNKADTLTGTAFLIADSSNVYLVTAKHLIGASLTATNQKQINSKIYIGNSVEKGNTKVPLPVLGKVPDQLKPYIFSADSEDIAIISLQKTEYRKLLDAIKGLGVIPIETTLFEFTIPADTKMLHHSWFTYRNKAGEKITMQGVFKDLSVVKNSTATVALKGFYRQGFNGAPILNFDNKLVGMFINGDNFLRNADIIADPYKTGNFATAVKSSAIMRQLKKLQETERQPDFNK